MIDWKKQGVTETEIETERERDRGKERGREMSNPKTFYGINQNLRQV